MVRPIKGWMQNWVHTLIQKACYPKFTVKMKGWEFTVLGPAPILVSSRHQDDRIHRLNPKGAVQCTVGNNWRCWSCWGKDELVGGRQGARYGQLITSPMWLIVTKKGNYNTECTGWSTAHETVLHLCLALVRPCLKYQTLFGPYASGKAWAAWKKPRRYWWGWQEVQKPSL